MSFRDSLREEDQLVLDTLKALALMRARLVEFRRFLLSRLTPLSVEYEVACNDYETGLILSAYVDADLGDGRSVVWWLDVTYDGKIWHIEPRITWNGQDEILPFTSTLINWIMLTAKTPRTPRLS
ncbi:MAG: hypothetical protein L0Y56_20780 [Nitrospira sp.]|nr:hypothetical protein [Nitrospira sp.]